MLTLFNLSRRATALLSLAFLLLLLGGGGIAWLLARKGFRRPLRVLLITPGALDPGTRLDAGEIRALGMLVQEQLELGGGCAVTNVTEVPARFDLFRNDARTLLIQLNPRRDEKKVSLAFSFVWASRIPGNGPPSWTHREGPSLLPRAAFHGFMRALPVPMNDKTDVLVPDDPSLFWDLNRASAWRLQNTHLEESLTLVERAVQRDPSCVTGWLLLGNLRYRRMLNHPGTFRQEQVEAEADLRRALELAPAHPRPVFLLSLIQSDSGNHREALELLLRARRLQPANPTLLTGIAYAARGSGLLALARRAMDLRDNLAWTELQPQAVDITCLYTGEIPRFEASLHERPGHLSSTTGVLPFYRGYLGLVKGDREVARQEFRTAAHMAHGSPNIQRLSEIYSLILEAKSDEAWRKLREYDQERIGMREPDGEFTLRLAEAYALMGDRASAMEMAGRAFARGFGCTAWYERSPMLDSLRTLPKWQALMQHVKERQTLMEGSFPAGILEEN